MRPEAMAGAAALAGEGVQVGEGIGSGVMGREAAGAGNWGVHCPLGGGSGARVGRPVGRRLQAAGQADACVACVIV